MNEMTLPSRHMTRIFESLWSEAELATSRSRRLHGHNIEASRVGKEETICFLDT